MLDFVAERWAVQAHAEPGVVIALALGVVVVTAVPRLWRVLRQASTIVHEMGHVLAAWATGRRVSGIKLHSDTSGVTTSSGKPYGLGLLITTLAGYPAPGALALGMAALASAGYAGASLTLFNVMLVLALLLSRNVVGVVSCVLALLAAGSIWWFNDETVVVYTAVALSVFYAVAGLRGTVDLVMVHLSPMRHGRNRQHRGALKQRASGTDAARARSAVRAFPVPVFVWLMFFAAASAACALGVVWILA